MKLDDVLEAYADLKRMKREVRTKKVGDEIRTEPIKGVDIEGREGELSLVYTITK